MNPSYQKNLGLKMAQLPEGFHIETVTRLTDTISCML